MFTYVCPESLCSCNVMKLYCFLLSDQSQIQVSVPRKGFSALTHALFGTKLNKNLHNDRDLIFCLAACELPNHWL